jgi:uncharacterized repeat protein (TIGR04052 family)
MTRYLLNKFLSGPTTLWLSVILLSGCFETKPPTKINFQPLYQNVAISCGSVFSPAGEDNQKENNLQQWQYSQLQFFIHDVEVNTIKKGWQPWLMITNANQTSTIALLGEACNERSEQGYWQLELTPLEEPSTITDIRFTLGVPFELNHLNPLTQPSPLNDSSMFWGWQGGHKFIRAELVSKDDDWLFHLGSTGCKALSPVRAPKNECLYPNRVVIALPFNSQTNTIEFDLAVLVNDIGLTRKNSCQSAGDEESCKVLFKNLGIHSNTTNGSILLNEQKVFKARKNLKVQNNG